MILTMWSVLLLPDHRGTDATVNLIFILSVFFLLCTHPKRVKDLRVQVESLAPEPDFKIFFSAQAVFGHWQTMPMVSESKIVSGLNQVIYYHQSLF